MSNTNNFLSYKNYIQVANENSQNTSLYFYIKNFCFRKMIGLVSQNSQNFTPEESAIIQKDLKDFKGETQNGNIRPLTKEEFTNFIEFFKHTKTDVFRHFKVVSFCRVGYDD